MLTVTPVVLCGGAGRRLWPLSTQDRPKPFLSFGQDTSLFQRTLLRLSGNPFEERPVVVAHQRNADLAATQARAIGVEITLVLEPEGRETCAAALAGILVAAQRRPDGLVGIFAADHNIPDQAGFVATLASGLQSASDGYLLTFGIAPRHASPDFGYILPGQMIGAGPARRVASFIEKPDSARAVVLLERGARWNSGNFLGSIPAWLTEASTHAVSVLAAVERALREGRADGGRVFLGDTFCEAPATAVDRAIMERSNKVAMIAADHAWSDLGSWDEIARQFGDGSDIFVLPGDLEVVVAGLEDVVVVVDGKRLLVTRKGQSATLKGILARK